MPACPSSSHKLILTEQPEKIFYIQKYEVGDGKLVVQNDTTEEEEDCVVDHEHSADDATTEAGAATTVEDIKLERSSHHDQQQQQQCAICLVEFERGDEISSSDCAQCFHHYHKTCILKWLLQHDECPSCRRPYLKFLGGGGEENGADAAEDVEAPAAAAESSAAPVRNQHHQRPQIAGPMYSDEVLFAASVLRRQSE